MQYQERVTAHGYVAATPTPSQPELDAHYRSKYFQSPSGSYQASYSDEERTYLRNIALVSHRTCETFGVPSTLFDIGCGEGFYSADMQALGWSVQCCDFSSHAIEKFNPSLLGCFMQGDAYGLIDRKAAAEERFGLVNLQNVLEHVIDPERLLARVKPLLDPCGGVARIRVPNDYSKFQLLLLERGLTDKTWFAPPEHLSYFNNESLTEFLTHCGYRVLSMHADFPIEVFLTNPHSNYWRDRSLGKSAHCSRLLVENFLIGENIDDYIAYASAAGRLGFGRDLTVYAQPLCLPERSATLASPPETTTASR